MKQVFRSKEEKHFASCGMTLIELIIGMFLIQILLVSGYSIYQIALESWDYSVNEASSQSLLRHTFALLAQDVWEAQATSFSSTDSSLCFRRTSKEICYKEKGGNVIREEAGKSRTILSGGQMKVTLMPAPDPASNAILALLAMSYKKASLSFLLRPRN